MKKNKIYIASDFERYHAGSMTDSEMHDLEKAALEDTFLADALDGYAFSPSAKKDMGELRERLFEKEKNKSKTPVYSLSRSAWWRIAALFIIIAGAGIIFYKISINSKQNVIAKTDGKESLNADSNVSLSNIKKAPSQDMVAFENSAGAKADKNKITLLPETKVKPDQKVTTRSSSKKEAEADMASVAVNAENEKPVDEYVLKGKVTDHESNLLAAASVKEKNYDVIATTDSPGNLSKVSPDTSANAIVTASEYNTKKGALQKDSQPVLATDKSNGAASEALLASVERSKTSRQQQMRSKVLEAQMKSVAPAANNPLFDEYVKTHIRPVYDENKVQQTGDVKLSFTVDKKGKPENIKIENSFCKACEAQAIELLKNGPLWPTETSSGKSVLIKF